MAAFLRGKGTAREFILISSRKHSLLSLHTRPFHSDLITCHGLAVEGLGKSRALNSPTSWEPGIFIQGWARVAGEFQKPQPGAYKASAQLALWYCCPSVRLWSNPAEAPWFCSGPSWQTVHSSADKGTVLGSLSPGQCSMGNSIRTWHSKAATFGTCSTTQQKANPPLVFSSFP